MSISQKSLIALCLVSFTTPLWAPNGQLPGKIKPTRPAKTYVRRLEEKPKHIPTFEPRGLLIFLDDSEQRPGGTLGQDLAAAINKKSGPIITSASLFIENKTHFFNLENWLIKKINDYLYLLLPHDYLTNLKFSIASVDSYSTKTISDDELKLGLKVNHMLSVNYKNPTATLPGRPDYADYFMDALYDETTKTSSIFCLRSDYFEYNKTHTDKIFTQPLWSIYFAGHGSFGNSIVDLKLDSFKKVLNFLATKINTRLLVYQSCYAAGYNAEIIYKESSDILQRTYPFAIITQALSDSVTTVVPEALRYDLFFKEITVPTRDIINYEKAMDALNTKEALNKETQEDLKKSNLAPRQDLSWSNVPQIKYPGLPYFTPMTNRKNTVSIGAILAKSRGDDRPLDIASFFKVDPKAILLYAADIPFELILNPNLDAIISMIPGDAIHIFKKISAPTKAAVPSKNIDQITDLFFKLEMLEPLKLFFIEKLSALDKTTQKLTTYKDVIFYSKYDFEENYVLQYAFFEKNGKIYEKDMSYPAEETTADAFIETQQKKPATYANQPFIEASAENTKMYTNLLNAVAQRSKIVQLGSFTIISINDYLKFPNLTGRTTLITSITGINNDLAALLEFMKLKTPSKSVSWVYELTGIYKPTPLLTLPGAAEDKAITLYDVIIDNTGEKSIIYYAYDGKDYLDGQEFYENYTQNYAPAPALRTGALLPSQATVEDIEKIQQVIDQKKEHKKNKK